jgi:hypothetical protein
MTLREDGVPPAASSLDLDGDGLVDNAIYQIVGALESASGYKFQPRIDAAIDRGELLMLTTYQGTGEGGTGAFTTLKGANPSPAPCASDSTCGHHLTGTASFTVAADSWRTAPLMGVDTTPYKGGPGQLVVEMLVFGTHPFQVPLFGARVQLNSASVPGTIGDGVLAGAITQGDLDTIVIPAFQRGMQEDIDADCNDPNTPPACGCTANSAGGKWVQMFDASADCKISPAEVSNNDLIKTLLAKDVMIDGTAGLSFGVRFSAAAGQFTP